MKTRIIIPKVAAFVMFAFAFSGCESTDSGGSAQVTSVYYGVGFYDPWYYGDYDYDYDVDIDVPDRPGNGGPRPEHPIARPPGEGGARPEQPIARPPSASERPTASQRPTTSQRPSVSQGPSARPSIPSTPRPAMRSGGGGGRRR